MSRRRPLPVRLPALACLLAFLGAAELRAEMRTWTAQSGTRVEAELLAMDDAGLLKLRTAEGREVSISLWSLSLADQAVARAFRDAQTAAQRAEAAARRQPKPARTPETRATPAQQVVAEMNLARTDPAGYAASLREYRARHRGGNQFDMESVGIVETREGLAAVDEAIRYLEAAKPVGSLEWAEILAAAAADHAADIGPKGLLGHDGSDGSSVSDRVARHGRWLHRVGENIAFGPSSPRMIVMQLLIDDGVPGRGHRHNIFQPDFKTAGVAFDQHTRYRTVCVTVFAGGVGRK